MSWEAQKSQIYLKSCIYLLFKPTLDYSCETKNGTMYHI